MACDELDDLERRTFAAWDRASLGDSRIAIRRELAGSQRRAAASAMRLL
jgi:hypothetical protein